MPRARLGVVGLGNMGGGIACNLAGAGYPLAVWDVAAPVLRPHHKK